MCKSSGSGGGGGDGAYRVESRRVFLGVNVFSDVHGNWEAYCAIIRSVIMSNSRCVCLGDLIDRGTRSCDIVIDYAARMKSERERFPHDPNRWQWFFVLGNHELMLKKWLTETNLMKKTSYWRIWTASGGGTIFFELFQFRQKLLDDGYSKEHANRELVKKIRTFLESFIYLMNNAYSKCYIRTEHLYVCSHAGPTDKHLHYGDGRPVIDPSTRGPKVSEGLLGEKTYGEYARRVCSRPMLDDRGEELCHEEKERFFKNRITLDHNSLRDLSLNKYYVFGHTPQPIGNINTRWNSKEEKYLFLPTDSGILNAIEGSFGIAVVGNIEPLKHNIKILHRIPGATKRRYKAPVFISFYSTEILEIWNEIAKEILSITPITVDALLRAFLISWVNAEWAKNLNITGLRRDERRGFYRDMRDSLEDTPTVCDLDYMPDRRGSDAATAGSFSPRE